MSKSPRIRVAVYDRHPLFLDGVVKSLSSEPDFDVVSQTGVAKDAGRFAALKAPDVFIVDLEACGGGAETVHAIMAACQKSKVLVLTGSESVEAVGVALRAGARGYVLKNVGGPELVAALRTVLNGDPYISHSLAMRYVMSNLSIGVVTAAAQTAANVRSLEVLTPREEQILGQVADGKTNKEIARSLDISEKTVKSYMTGIMQKLQVRNRVEAVIMARSTERRPSAIAVSDVSTNRRSPSPH